MGRWVRGGLSWGSKGQVGGKEGGMRGSRGLFMGGKGLHYPIFHLSASVRGRFWSSCLHG